MIVDWYFLLVGIIIGLSIAAPVGPVGIVCIRRTLVRGRLSGLVSGFGAATADGFYGVVAAFGLTVISDILVGHLFFLRLLGGLFLVYLGIRTCVAKPAVDPVSADESNLPGDYWTTLVLTLTNPLTILSFAGVFAALGVGSSQGDFFSSVMMVLGVIAGSVLWWVILVSGIAAFRSRFNPRLLELVNRVSGSIIVLFGIFTLPACSYEACKSASHIPGYAGIISFL